MADEKIISLGQLSANGTGQWIALGGPDGIATIATCQVTMGGAATAATVDVEYSLDKLGGVSLLTAALTNAAPSDGTTGISTKAVYARMKLSGLTGAGFVVGNLIAEV